MENQKLVQLATDIAKHHGIDPLLLRAIVTIESSWRPWATRYEPAYHYFYFYNEHASKCRIDPMYEKFLQATSWGLCQVMGGVCRENGFEGNLTDVLKPEISLLMGCLKLKELMVRYGEDSESKIIAAYNAGSARKLPSGVFVNQQYLNKVNMELVGLRKLK